MKSLATILLLLGCAGAQSSTVAITRVTVVDVRDGSLHPEQTVVITGNRIAAVAPANEIFDSRVAPNNAVTFTLGATQVIRGGRSRECG